MCSSACLEVLLYHPPCRSGRNKVGVQTAFPSAILISPSHSQKNGLLRIQEIFPTDGGEEKENIFDKRVDDRGGKRGSENQRGVISLTHTYIHGWAEGLIFGGRLRQNG